MLYKVLKRYIEIGDVEPLVGDKIFRRYIVTGGAEPLVIFILRIFGVIDDVLWLKVLAIEAAMACNKVIPSGNKSLTTT